MPWSETRDPYRIWLSEVILQQTQVSQGIAYYQSFIKTFPTVFDLANASEERVLKAWQGLGYNTRARNLHAAARQIVNDYHGELPGTASELQKLRGVGPYTAAAIASFAFGEKIPVVDSNVIRLMCRMKGITDLSTSPATLRVIREALYRVLPDKDPAAFNQAIMNFGALQCKPRQPLCHSCPFASDCRALKDHNVSHIPVKKPATRRKHRFFHYFFISNGSGVLLRKRQSKDIWQGMFDLPLIETTSSTLLTTEKQLDFVLQFAPGTMNAQVSVDTDHQTLTHQVINCCFYSYRISDYREKQPNASVKFVEFEKLSTFALPAIIDCYFRAKSILL